MTWQPEVDEIRRREELAQKMGGEANVKRQHDNGRLTVRERIDRFLDKGSFHEMGALAGKPDYNDEGKLVGAIVAIARHGSIVHYEAHGMSDRLTFIEGSIFANVDCSHTFDLIISNPPYVRQDEAIFYPNQCRGPR